MNSMRNVAVTGGAVVVIILVATFFFNRGGDGGDRENGGGLSIFVSIPPQEYFVRQVVGDNARVEVLLPSGASPATYEPNARQLALLSEADVFFRIGVPFENSLIPKIMSIAPNLEIVDTRRGVKLLGTDPHIWMNPLNVKIMAGTICDTIKRLDGDVSGKYERGRDDFLMRLDEIDSQLRGVLAPLKGSTLFVFHPAFGYFAEAYGLKQIAIENQGKEPSAKQLAALIDLARGRNVKAIFVQMQFSMKSANTIAEAIGGVVIPLDPLARDYIGSLKEIARQVKTGLERK